jgi:ATP-dependent metalloprotease
MLTDLSSRARGVEGAPKLAPGRSPSVPLHVVVVPEGGGYDAFRNASRASKSQSAVRSGGLINFVFYGALTAVIGSAAMGAAQRHAGKVTTTSSSGAASVSSSAASGSAGSTNAASPGGGAAGLLPGGADAGGKRPSLPGVGGEPAGKSSFDPKEYDAGAISEQSRKTFDDVKGCDEAKAELQEIVEYLKNPDLFTKLGGKLPKGVLLSGPPGTGKTLLARAVAGEAGVPFFYRAGSEFEEMFVGVGSKRVRQLFKAAKAKMPCIIFIDEIDAVGTSRKAFETQSRKTLNQLLTEMDGFEQNEGIIVIAATNIPEQLDPALTRPGRFDRLVHVPNPDIGGRREILRHYLLNKPVADDVDVESIARGTSGFSGAELFNLVNMAAVQAAVSGETAISLERLEWAKDRIIMGVERKSAVLTEESKKLTAYHEAGHAVVALRTPGAMPVHKATIVPRGNALGMVTQLPDKDETSITRKQLLARLDVCMGGRVAEELIFGKDEVTTGALSDLQQATRLATYMVGEVGLSALVGPVHVDSMSKGGRRATEALVDKEVVQLLRDSHARVTKLLTRHTGDLHALSAEMLAKETLTGPEIVRLLGLAPGGPGDKQAGAGKRGGGERGRRGAADDKREKAASAEKDAKEGEEDGGTRAGGDDVVDPDADAILGPGILEPVEDRAKASTAA